MYFFNMNTKYYVFLLSNEILINIFYCLHICFLGFQWVTYNWLSQEKHGAHIFLGSMTSA